MAITLISWICRLAVGVMFVMASIPKLTMQDAPQAMFAEIGGKPMMLLTGVLELVAAVLILVPRTKVYGAALALGVMGGAIVSHIAVLEDDAMLPMAIGLFIAAGVVLVLHRHELPFFAGSGKGAAE